MANCILYGRSLVFSCLYIAFAFFGVALAGTQKAAAQTRIIYGTAKDGATGRQIPFPHILVDGGKLEGFGDMEGHFTLTIPANSRHLTVKAYMFLEAELDLGQADSVVAILYYAHPFTFQSITAPATRKLIQSLTASRSKIDPRKESNYQYSSYNKLVITTGYMSALKLHMDHLLGMFGRNRLTSFGSEHHILLMESAGKRYFKSRFQQRESIVASKISGINRPPAITLASGFEPLSVYESFLRIGTRKYISPLAGRPNKRYIFFVQDTIRLDSQEIYVVKFNPKSLRNKDLLQGFLYITKSPVGVVGFQMWPAFDNESTFSMLQQCELLPSGRWFPTQIKTTYQRSRLGGLRIPVEASSKTYIFNQESMAGKPHPVFDEVVFDFQKDSLDTDSIFPATFRQERLTVKDKSTYSFFDRVGSLDAVDRYLNFGQKLMAGRIPFGRVDLVFRKAITVNDFEGLRLGIGLQSTEKWSETHQGGGYLARGLKDERTKFGLNYQYTFNRRHSLGVAYQSDLSEPGIQTFAYNKVQYPTEALRNIRIPRFDLIRHGELIHTMRWAPNLITRLAAEAGYRRYLYDYKFLPDSTSNTINLAEIKGTLRWTSGEQFARYGYERFSLGNPYPEYWLQISQGIPVVGQRSYAYTRIETKLQWSRRLLGFGEIGIQISSGIVYGSIPYPLLFSARGSFKDVSLLSYNSFETMRYNEFVNDRYFQVFISQKFSRMQISTLPYRPYFTLLHNMGWGDVGNKDMHKGVIIKGMPFGYYETGLFLNDLFVIPLAGVSLGIGAGAFLRYGPYALDGLNNMAIKFSTNLSL